MTDRIDRFAAWAAALDIDDVPDDVRERLRLQVGNGIAAARAGTTAEWLVPETGSGDATVVGGDTTEYHTAAFTNAAASMVHDYDDYLFMGHTGHSAIFGSLAACEHEDADGAALLESVLVANELEGRLGAAVAIGPHNGQMWAFIHQAGAAAAAARLAGDERAIAEAVRLALYNPDYPLEAGFIDGDSKVFTAAKPTAAGLRIGEAAVRGARGSPDALANFLSSYGYVPFPEMLDGFGDAWVTRSLCMKPRPGCAYVQSPLECLERITDRGVSADDIERITVRAPLPTVAMEGLSSPYRGPGRRLHPINVTFSVEYALALQLVAGRITPDALTESAIAANRSSLDAVARTVEVVHDWEQTADVLRGLGKGVDYGPLLSDRGLVTMARGFRQLGDSYSSLDSRREAVDLLRSGRVFSVLRSLRSPLRWSSFDMSRARFDDLSFNFGATVTVETANDQYRASTREHAGACGRPLETVTETVAEKFQREVGDGFAVVTGIEDRPLEDVTALL